MVVVKHFLTHECDKEEDIGELLTNFILKEEISEKDIIDIKYTSTCAAHDTSNFSVLLIYRKNLF